MQNVFYRSNVVINMCYNIASRYSFLQLFNDISLFFCTSAALHLYNTATKLPLLRATLSNLPNYRCSSKLNAKLERPVLCWLVSGEIMDGKLRFLF